MRIFATAAAALAACVPLVGASTLGQQLVNKPEADVSATAQYPAHNFSIPVDHFHNQSMYEPHSDARFNNRYWFDDSHYKPGGPVFLLISGEINGDYRLPIIQKGIIYQFNKLFGGMGVLLEHRYFGRSQPQPDLSTKNYRFCTTDQALADAVYFAENIKFPGHEHENLTAHAVPWIAYGGSYAGAFVAFLRTQYPGVFWGSISSSGVTKAITDYWQYFQPIIDYAPKACIANLRLLTNVIDNILLGKQASSQHRRDNDGSLSKGNKALIQELKDSFGLGGMPYDDDFAFALGSANNGWQSLNWDPALNSTQFGEFCNNLTATTPLYHPDARKTAEAKKLITEGGHGGQVGALTTPLLNWQGYANATLAAPCKDQKTCYNTHEPSQYKKTDWDQWSLKSWPYMYCTQWGFLQSGSGYPAGQLPIASRTTTVPYLSIICEQAFGIRRPPNTDAINSRGGFDIAYPRLAIVGGARDPWRPSTPLADDAGYQRRPNTTDQPVILISDGVHHWDENGLLPAETKPGLPPAPVANAQDQMHAFVKAWLDEAKGHFAAKNEM